VLLDNQPSTEAQKDENDGKTSPMFHILKTADL